MRPYSLPIGRHDESIVVKLLPCLEFHAVVVGVQLFVIVHGHVSSAGRAVLEGVALILDIDLKLREQPSVAGEVLILRPAPIGQ